MGDDRRAAPHPDATEPALALARACAEHDIVCENAYAPQGDEPGRAFLAVKRDLTDIAVMARLRAAALPCELIQIHPKPVQAPPKKRAAKKPATKKPAARKPTKKPARKPATRSTTRTRKR